MRPEYRIVLYLALVSSLFLISHLVILLLLVSVLLLMLLRLPGKVVRSGALPIGLFLAFTFLSNAFNQHGRILLSAGPVLLTEEGLRFALIRTMRVMIMVFGGKVFLATVAADDLLMGLRRLLRPVEILGLPLHDFFHTMGLTMKCFPVLKTRVTEQYRLSVGSGKAIGLAGRARATAGFLLPLFVRSVQHPEDFFEGVSGDDR